MKDNAKVTLTIGQLKRLVKEDGDPDIDWCINGAKIAVIDRIVWQAGNFFEDHPDATKEMIAQEVVDELKYDDGLLEKVRTLYYYLKQKANQNNLSKDHLNGNTQI